MNWSALGWLGWACVSALFLWRFHSPRASGEVRTLHEPWEAEGSPPPPGHAVSCSAEQLIRPALPESPWSGPRR
jgi:hypothetical protein